MNRKIWIPVLITVLVLCVVCVIVLFHVLPGDPSTEITEPEDIMLAEFQGMLATADQMLGSGEVIIKNNHEYLVHFVNASARCYPEAFSYTDKIYSIDTAKLAISTKPAEQGSSEWKEEHTLRYLLLLTQLLEKYPPDCFLLTGMLWDEYKNIYVPPRLWLLHEYKTAGYESAEAYLFEVFHGELSTDLPVIFHFSLNPGDEIAIHLYGDSFTYLQNNYYYQLDAR